MATVETCTQVRWMIRRDMEQVVKIYRNHVSMDSPVQVNDLLVKHLRQRNVIGIVEEEPDNGYIHGFSIYELHKDFLRILWIAGDNESIKVHLNRLFGKLSEHRRRYIEYACPISNVLLQKTLADQGMFCYKEENEEMFFSYYI
jgi:tRNA U54 and U55 pseudouridine synthase Pus10